MKIDRVLKTEYIPRIVNPVKKGVPKRVSFQGGFTNAVKKRGTSWITSISYRFAELAGENWNIIITAIGTGLVAPLMIAKNPFTKDDKDSKYYMAIRQPISAVLAVVAQLGVCLQVGKYIDKLAQNGELKNFDLKVLEGCKNKLERAKRLDTLSPAAKKTADITLERLNVFKDRTGFLLAVLTIPVTCTILNWAHPRFIELFFPELAKDKKAENGK